MVVSLRFRGKTCLRQRIILSLLTGRTIVVEDIAADKESTLSDYELNLLELVEKISSGTKVQHSKSKLQFTPGTLIGGEITHDCNAARSISYYLEVLLPLAPFCKRPIQAILNGITNDQIDPDIDSIKVSCLPTLKRFIGDVEGTKLDIKVGARGFKPLNGGQVTFTCPVVRQLQPVQLTDAGKIKRIRGVAVASRVSPQMANRLIDTSKGMLLRFIPDVYIYSDHSKGKTSGLSPGFSLSLSAETTEGCFYTGTSVSNSKGSGEGPSIPEDLAKDATHILFEEIHRGGCIDSISQSLTLVLMAFNQKDVSSVKFGLLTSYTTQFMKNLKEFCGLTFRLEPLQNDEVVATCSGIGYKNLSRPTY